MLGKDEVINELSRHIEICKKYDEGFSQMKLDALEAILLYLTYDERNPVIVCPHCGKRVK